MTGHLLNKNIQIIYTLSDDNFQRNNVSGTEEWKGEKGKSVKK